MSIVSLGIDSTYQPSIADRKSLVPRPRPAVGPSDPPISQGRINGSGQMPSTVYVAVKVIGQGSFGSVILARERENENFVAIKKVLQDRRYKNRELEIMQSLSLKPHPNVILLKQSFESKGSNSNNSSGSNTSHSSNRSGMNKRGGLQQSNNAPDEVYLHLVLEYVPETLYSLTKYYRKQRQNVMPSNLVKLYFYQLLRGLAHIHGMNVCHRDIKPENVLVDPVKNIVKLCDFGSSKILVPNEPNIAYICSRFYRAPELILGNTCYNTAVDVWSAGCVLAEMIQGTPLFPGSSNVDQLVEIIKVLGAPSKEQLFQLNPSNTALKIPPLQLSLWNSILPHASEEAIDLLRAILKYVPQERLTAIDACCTRYFDEVRSPSYLMPNGLPMPNSLQGHFTNEEIKLASPTTIELLTSKDIHRQDTGTVNVLDSSKLLNDTTTARKKGRGNIRKIMEFTDD